MPTVVFLPETLLRDLPPDWVLEPWCDCTHDGTVRVGDLIEHHGERRLVEMAAKLRCRRCGREPTTLIATEPDPPADPLRPLWGVVMIWGAVTLRGPDD